MIEVFPSDCRKLDFLRPAIEQTFQIIDEFIAQYADSSRIQLPYATNERATLSVLAGGIWRSHASSLVLEEYACVKGAKGASWNGRRDLWFRLGDHVCHGEAKQEDWPDAARFTDAEASACMRRAMREARAAIRDSGNPTWVEKYRPDEVKQVAVPDRIRCVGIGFVVPFLFWQERKRNEVIMEKYALKLRAAAQRLTREENCQVLWGRYYRPALLEELEFFVSRWKGTRLAMPELDIVLCEIPNE